MIWLITSYLLNIMILFFLGFPINKHTHTNHSFSAERYSWSKASCATWRPSAAPWPCEWRGWGLFGPESAGKTWEKPGKHMEKPWEHLGKTQQNTAKPGPAKIMLETASKDKMKLCRYIHQIHQISPDISKSTAPQPTPWGTWCDLYALAVPRSSTWSMWLITSKKKTYVTYLWHISHICMVLI